MKCCNSFLDLISAWGAEKRIYTVVYYRKVAFSHGFVLILRRTRAPKSVYRQNAKFPRFVLVLQACFLYKNEKLSSQITQLFSRNSVPKIQKLSFSEMSKA